MGYIIDVIFVIRELMLLLLVVITSPFGILGGLLLLDNKSL